MEKQKLNILFVTPWFPHEENPVEGTFVYEMAKTVCLNENVWVVHLVPSKSFSKRGIEIKEFKEIPLIKLKYPEGIFSRFFIVIKLLKIVKYLKSIGIKPDILHAHVFPTAIYTGILSIVMNVPSVVSLHWSGFFTQRMGFLDFLQLKIGAKLSTYLLPVSEGLMLRLKRIGLKGQYLVIPNAFDPHIFYPSPERKNKLLSMITVGALIPIKGIDILIKALYIIKKRYSKFLLHIVGNGREKKRYEMMVKKLGLEENIIFHGTISKPDVAKLMRKSHFFILPSHMETFGVVIVEALACGLPVVATCVSGPKSIIKESWMGRLVPPGDEEALAEAIEYMIKNYKRFPSKRIANYAFEKYSLKSIGEILSTLYHNLRRNKNES